LSFDFTQTNWETKVSGKWLITKNTDSIEFSFPRFTPSSSGDFAEASGKAKIPLSSSGKYYLIFSVYDSYVAAVSGCHFKQVLLDDSVVWEDDVEGDENPQDLRKVDITERVRGKEEIKISFRACDKKGVSNFDIKIRYFNVFLSK
jgi:hypothetical protein